ncbi:MAG TPA: hypothetical protein VL147_01655 [Devosia sp.]|nr:hypothetical protein [Devosia sp.]
MMAALVFFVAWGVAALVPLIIADRAVENVRSIKFGLGTPESRAKDATLELMLRVIVLLLAGILAAAITVCAILVHWI